MQHPLQGAKPGLERLCDCCDRPIGCFAVSADLVNQRDRPQQKVIALTIRVTRKPPTLTEVCRQPDGTEQMVTVPNPECNQDDMVIVATWERGVDVCDSKDCFLTLMERFWREAKRKTRDLWKEQDKED